MPPFRAIFFGTPQLSADILVHLLASDIIDIVAVVSNPDTTGGRGHALIQSAVTQLSHEKNIPLLQPEKVKNNPAFIEEIQALNPDICLVVAYGKILPKELLDIPKMGFLNVHTSLLPKYRGAAPIQHALLNGETHTGLTVQQMSLGMDEGDILHQESWEIAENDTTGTLWNKTGQRGGPLLLATIAGLKHGTLTPIPQDHTLATYTSYIEKQHGEIQPLWTLDHAYHAWQSYTPWPGLYTYFGETKVILHTVSRGDKAGIFVSKSTDNSHTVWGTYDGLPALAFSDGYLLIHELTPAGKKKMSGRDFIRGFMG